MNTTSQEYESAPVDFDPFGNSQELLATAPSTEQQREIWAAAMLRDEASCAYNATMCLRLKGPLELECLRQAVSALSERHDALRLSFSPDGQTICFASEIPLPVEVLDLARTGISLDDFRFSEVTAPFDLTNGPLFRCRIARLDDNEHAILMSAHHLVCDGWSIGLLINDLAMLYNALRRGEQDAIEPAPSFQQYANECAEDSASDEHEAREQFWLRRLRDAPARIHLPADYPPPGKRSFDAGFETRHIGGEVLDSIRRKGKDAGCTSFTVVAAAFAAYLHKLTGQDDIVIGVPAAGQAEEGWNDLVGHCVSLLPVRSQYRPGISFANFLRSFRNAMADAYEHRGCSMGRLIQRLGLPRDPTYIPLVQVVLNTDRAVEHPQFDGLHCTFDCVPRPYENFELFMNTVETQTGLQLECAYDSNIMSADSAQRRLAELETFIRRLCDTEDEVLESISIVTDAERRKLLEEWGSGPALSLPEARVDELVRAQCERAPDAIAASSGEVALCYRELADKAARIAGQLRALGVARKSVVGVLMSRQPDLLAVLLGIWEAGAAYLPLDPEHPPERLQLMLEDAAAALTITDAAVNADSDNGQPMLPTEYGGRVVDYASLLADHSAAAADLARDAHTAATGSPARSSDLAENHSPDDAAYLIYTSGSTGRPKGVVVPHRTVVNFLLGMREQLHIGPRNRVLALTTLSFDIAVLELWLPLICGARTEVVPREVSRDGDRLRDWIEHYQPDLMQATPATWQLLLDAGWQGNSDVTALSGGEALPVPLARAVLERVQSLWNMYGPTETTVWSTCHRVDHRDDPIPIGKPIANTRVYVLDNAGQPVPVGVPGELYIGGDGVTDGYLNRAELTAQRFVPDPFSNKSGARMYRTGDRVRFGSAGQLEYFGRFDYQIKLRGYRIEPGEIEAALQTRAEIRDAVVSVYSEGGADDARLVAYLVLSADARLNIDALRRELRAQLPAYMVPQHFVELDALPLTNSGKVDRKALPSPTLQTSRAHVPPRTETEQQVAAIWQEILGIEQVSANDNFFDLGGHSLLAARFVTRVREQIERDLSIGVIFDTPVLADLAEALAEAPFMHDASNSTTIQTERVEI